MYFLTKPYMWTSYLYFQFQNFTVLISQNPKHDIALYLFHMGTSAARNHPHKHSTVYGIRELPQRGYANNYYIPVNQIVIMFTSASYKMNKSFNKEHFFILPVIYQFVSTQVSSIPQMTIITYTWFKVCDVNVSTMSYLWSWCSILNKSKHNKHHMHLGRSAFNSDFKDTKPGNC